MKVELLKWLRDIGETNSANLLENCSVNLVYIDTLFELEGDGMTDLMDVQIGVPGSHYTKMKSKYSKEVKIIEEQISEVATAIGMHVRRTTWHPKIKSEDDMKLKISIVARQSIFDEITLNKISWSGRLKEPDFLNRIFNLSELPSNDTRFENAYDDIHKHRIMNYDWEDNWVFTDRRFNLLHCDEWNCNKKVDNQLRSSCGLFAF